MMRALAGLWNLKTTIAATSRPRWKPGQLWGICADPLERGAGSPRRLIVRSGCPEQALPRLLAAALRLRAAARPPGGGRARPCPGFFHAPDTRETPGPYRG